MSQPLTPVVRVILEDLEGRILLLCRSNDSKHAPRMYCLPGGKVDYREPVDVTCIREVKIETGLDISNLVTLTWQDNLPYFEGGMHVINLYYKADYSGEVVLNHESSGHIWAKKEDIDTLPIAFRNDEAIKDYFERKEAA